MTTNVVNAIMTPFLMTRSSPIYISLIYIYIYHCDYVFWFVEDLKILITTHNHPNSYKFSKQTKKFWWKTRNTHAHIHTQRTDKNSKKLSKKEQKWLRAWGFESRLLIINLWIWNRDFQATYRKNFKKLLYIWKSEKNCLPPNTKTTMRMVNFIITR